jgi:glyoxylase-like metal-dependent hydrolase (beta-lactamase superfamily II)
VHTFKQVSPHVYWLSPYSETDRPALAAVVGTERTLMLDTGNSAAHVAAFLAELTPAGIRHPAYAAITHWHWDHIFGGSALNIPLIAHELTAKEIALQASYDWSDDALDQRVTDGLEITFCSDMIKKELPDRSDLVIALPDMVFKGELTLNLGGVTCQLTHVGGDHALDSVVMYIPEDKVLFLGDCLYQAIYAPQRYYRVSEQLALVDRLSKYEVEVAIMGHHDEVLDKAAWQEDLNFYREVGAIVQQHKANPEAVLAAIAARQWSDAEWAQELAELYLQGEQVNAV